ncbi:MAG: hypothetical protein OXH32_03840 [Acidobacteria bacterium]|nr:hypothetical protein [Acidobacteriota bacterium]
MKQVPKVTKKDYIALLRRLKKSPHVVIWVRGHGDPADHGESENFQYVVTAAQAEGLVEYKGYRLHMMIAGEKFLRDWQWRWPKRIAIALGALVVFLESLASLVAYLVERSG